MSLKNLIVFVLAVMVGSQSAFAYGAVARSNNISGGSSQIQYFSVTGYENAVMARQGLSERIVNLSEFTVHGVPDGQSIVVGYCFNPSTNFATVVFNMASSIGEARTGVQSTCSSLAFNAADTSAVRSRCAPQSNSPIAISAAETCFANARRGNFVEGIALAEPVLQSCPRGQERQGNVCRVTQTSCNNINQIFTGGSCRSCAGNTPIRNGNVCIALSTGGGSSSGSSGSGGGGSGSTFLYVGAGAAVVGALYFFTSPDTIGRFSFSPDYNYSLTENGYAYNIGGHWNYQRDNWRLHWTAGQNNSNGEFGDFRYSSGAEYDSGFWAAEFSESVSGKVADYDFSLSAKMDGGNWEISPIYRLQSHYENLLTGWESNTNNSLNLESIWRYNRWRVKPSAGFQWQNVNEFGDNVQFNLLAVWQF